MKHKDGSGNLVFFREESHGTSDDLSTVFGLMLHCIRISPNKGEYILSHIMCCHDGAK